MERIKLEYHGDGLWVVLEEYKHLDYTIPEGFLTNGASIPVILQGLFNPIDDRWVTASVIHDYLYYKRIGRLKADNIFRKLAIEEGTPTELACLFYITLRICGWYYY